MKLMLHSRRNFLLGAGTSLALPFFPSLRSAWAQEAPIPTRLVFLFTPNGMHMPAWTPSGQGQDYDLPYMLEPLAPIQSQVNVLSGLHNEAAIYPLPGDHARGTGTFLTCTPLAEPQEPFQNGISVDQVAAQALGAQTPLSESGARARGRGLHGELRLWLLLCLCTLDQLGRSAHRSPQDDGSEAGV